MGDDFQTVGDVEATGRDADQLAAVALSWLVGAGIVAARRDDGCVLGAGPGYPPGPLWAQAVTEPDELLTRRWTNGMKIHTGRRVLHSGQGEVERAGCPRCGAWVRFVDPERACGEPGRHDAAAWALFDAAIGGWLEGGDGLLDCSACGVELGLNDWRWEPRWAFGHLGFHFWNWPPLRPEFVAEFSRRLGHRVVCVSGRL